MPLPASRFNQYITGVVAADGTCTVSLRTDGSGVAWHLTLISVSTTSAVKQPEANLYLDGIFIEGTYSGAGDSSSTDHVMDSTNVLTCTWTGADVGATVVLRVSGWRYAGGLRDVTP